MALADEALAHFLVLISFVTTLRKSNSRQFVHSVQTKHKLLEGPHFLRIQKVLEELNDPLRFVDLDHLVVKEVKGRVLRGVSHLYIMVCAADVRWSNFNISLVRLTDLFLAPIILHLSGAVDKTTN